MADNPYSAAMRRNFGIAFYTIGALLFTYLVIQSISSGRTSGFWRYSRIVGESYTTTTNPSQFWLIVLFYATAATVFALFAWRSYRG